MENLEAQTAPLAGGPSPTQGSASVTHCTDCGEELDEEEFESPQRDASGDVICDECYDERYLDYCDRCMEKIEKTELEATPGQLIAVWREAPGRPNDLSPGYYRVKEWPIYADGVIEAYMISSSLERVGDLDADGQRAAKDAWTPCGPMCLTCREQVEAYMKTPNLELDRFEAAMERINSRIEANAERY